MIFFLTLTYPPDASELPSNFSEYCKYHPLSGTDDYWWVLMINDEHPSIKEAVEGEFDPAISVMDLLEMFGFEGLQKLSGEEVKNVNQ